MKMRVLMSATLGALALGAFAFGAQAAPAGGVLAAVDRDGARVSDVEQVTWRHRHRHRHCYWHRGHWHCWHHHRHHRHYYRHW